MLNVVLMRVNAPLQISQKCTFVRAQQQIAIPVNIIEHIFILANAPNI